MREQIQAYIQRCHGNEQATEHRADFGKERSTKPVDWSSMKDGRPSFFVESRPVAYQDTAPYFKVHLPEKHSWVYLGRRRNLLLVPPLVGSRAISAPETGWCAVQIASGADLAELGELLQAAWDARRREHPISLKAPAGGSEDAP